VHDVAVLKLSIGPLRLAFAPLFELVELVVLAGVVIGDGVDCVVNIALFMRSGASCRCPRWLEFTSKLLEGSLVCFSPPLLVSPAVSAVVFVSRMEATGGVVYWGLVELEVVAVGLDPGGFDVDREVVLRRLMVGIEVDVFVLLIATFKGT
jgi:hypothetical protein